MADLSVGKPLNDTKRKAAFERKLAEWDMLNAYKPVQKNKDSHEDDNFIGSHVIYKRRLGGLPNCESSHGATVTEIRLTLVVTHPLRTSIYIRSHPFAVCCILIRHRTNRRQFRISSGSLVHPDCLRTPVSSSCDT